MTATMTCISVLRVGVPTTTCGLEKDPNAAALLDRFQSVMVDHIVGQSIHPLSDESKVDRTKQESRLRQQHRLLSLSNRYFDASVFVAELDAAHANIQDQIRDVMMNQQQPQQQPQQPQQQQQENSSRIQLEFEKQQSTTIPIALAEDGLILVFDDRVTHIDWDVRNDADNDNGDKDGSGSVPSQPSVAAAAAAAAAAASFDRCNVVHNRAEIIGVGSGLRLCVAITQMPSDTTTAASSPQQQQQQYEDKDIPAPSWREQEYARRIGWCLDRGYEYVEADLTESGIRRGHNVRDKEGFARIMEAMTGHVWTSATMHPRKVKELQSAYQSTKQEQLHDKQAQRLDNKPIVSSNSADDDDRSNAYEPPSFDLISKGVTELKEVKSDQAIHSDEEREALARRVLLEQSDLEGKQDKLEHVSSNHREMNPSAEDREAFEQERLMDQLEGAVREATRIRELSQSGALSDEERRQRAGDAAMLLMNLMNQIGPDDEDDNGSNRHDASDESDQDEPA